MIITVAAFLTTLGFAGFVVGSVFEMREVAVIGGVLIVGVGAMVTQNGLSHRSGEVTQNVSADTSATEYEYQRVETQTQLPLGTMWMLLGGALVLRSLTRLSES